MEKEYESAWAKLKRFKVQSYNEETEEILQRFLSSLATQNERMVLTYLANGMDPNSRTKNNATPLHLCAERNLPDMAEILLQNKRTKINLGNIYGMTPLNTASRYGSKDVVKVLLEYGAQTNITNVMKNTPLHNAVLSNHINIVQLLLHYRANPNVINCFYFTPLFLAANDKENFDVTRLLLRNGADPNYWDELHTMPLLLECCLSCKTEKKVQIIRLLLKCGADVDIICKLTGNSALHVVAVTGYRNLIRVLLKYGANKTCKNNKGFIPYELALQHGHYEAASILQCRQDSVSKEFSDISKLLLSNSSTD